MPPRRSQPISYNERNAEDTLIRCKGGGKRQRGILKTARCFGAQQSKLCEVLLSDSGKTLQRSNFLSTAGLTNALAGPDGCHFPSAIEMLVSLKKGRKEAAYLLSLMHSVFGLAASQPDRTYDCFLFRASCWPAYLIQKTAGCSAAAKLCLWPHAMSFACWLVFRAAI